MGASETGDQEAFTEAVAEFDSLTRLDAFKTALLVRPAALLLFGAEKKALLHCTAAAAALCSPSPPPPPFPAPLQLRAKKKLTEQPTEDEEDLT